MTAIVFVHGINVRHADFQQTFSVVSSQVNQLLPGSQLVPCNWGDSFGASLRAGGRSIPTYDTTKDATSVIPEFESATLWETLYRDPLFEMRLLGSVQASRDTIAPPHSIGAVGDWLALLDGVSLNARVSDLATDSALLPYLDAAIATLRTSDKLNEALKNPDDTMAELPGVAARSITAQMIDLAFRASQCAIQGDQRDALAIAIEDVLGGKAKGVVEWLSAPLAGLAKHMANRYLKRNRRSVSDLACPVIGDLIVYQGRGAPIRGRIAETLHTLDGPAIVIAHSLGGVAVADALLLDPALRSKVCHLVTVGSQAGFFYEINGLIGLPYGDETGLPSDFPPWLNFYDKSDMLSYLVAPVLGAKARDVELSSNQPFPQSHSAYWTSTPMWKCIATAVAACVPT